MTFKEDSQKEIDDISHIIIWCVDLDENNNFLRAEIYSSMNMEKVSKNDSSPFTNVVPSKKYIHNALEQFKTLDWSKFKASSKGIGAVSYMYNSNPDKAVCTNEQER